VELHQESRTVERIGGYRSGAKATSDSSAGNAADAKEKAMPAQHRTNEAPNANDLSSHPLPISFDDPFSQLTHKANIVVE